MIASKFSLSVKKSIVAIANGRDERKENDLMVSLKYELNNNNDHKNGPKQCIRAYVTFCGGKRAEKMS